MSEFFAINQALKRFGGFVRYYDTTEPLQELALLVSSGNCQKILACCGGGNQALTMLGCSGGKASLWAVDINPAQLFVLAAKAQFFKQKDSMPSFEQLRKSYPGRITSVKRNIRHLQEMDLCHLVTGKIIAPPQALIDRYALVLDDEMFALPKPDLYWQKDVLFSKRVRAGIGSLRFARMDIFDSPDHFKQGSLDLIYISDIFWPEALAYYQLKLAKMVRLLRPGGRIITYLDAGDDFMGRGVSPGRMLAQEAKKLNLKINADPSRGGYLVLEAMRRGK